MRSRADPDGVEVWANVLNGHTVMFTLRALVETSLVAVQTRSLLIFFVDYGLGCIIV